MNILLFSPIPSHPHYHGHRKRIYNLTNYLKKLNHTVHFVYFNEDPLKDCDLEAMQKAWDTFTLIPRKKRLDLRHGNYKLDEWYQEDIALHVNKIIDLFDIDIIWMNYVWQSKLLLDIPSDVVKVIDTHDKFSDRYKLLGSNGDKSYAWFSCSKEDEAIYLNRADIVVGIQNEEAAYFNSIASSKVHTVGHIESEHTNPKEYTKLQTIGFLGAHNLVNEKAINDFLEVFYTQSKYKTDLKIKIAGTVCNAINIENKNLILLGLVDNLDNFYYDVDLIINPLLFGTGLKIKSAEALAYGVPIVSSRIGFEGIGSESLYHNTSSSLEMVRLLDSIYENPNELQNLADLSKDIFTTYERIILSNIDTILQLCTPKNKHIDIKLLELYKELQNQRVEAITSKGSEYTELMRKIKGICELSIIRHPLLKFQAYKEMLKQYHFFRKQ